MSQSTLPPAMPTVSNPAAPSKAMFWTGWVLSALPSLLLLSGAVFYFAKPEMMRDNTAKMGFPPERIWLLVTIEVACAILYLIPQTAFFGAILVTAYLGGAVATHVRVFDPGWPMAVVCGVLIWLGLLLREPRLRPLLPFRNV